MVYFTEFCYSEIFFYIQYIQIVYIFYIQTLKGITEMLKMPEREEFTNVYKKFSNESGLNLPCTEFFLPN